MACLSSSIPRVSRRLSPLVSSCRRSSFSNYNLSAVGQESDADALQLFLISEQAGLILRSFHNRNQGAALTPARQS